MGRSVSYARHSISVCYDTIDCEDDCFAYDFMREAIVHKGKSLFPSMSECGVWLGNEDHAILENDFAYIGMSEYCGLVSIWLVCKGDHEDIEHYDLALAWCNRVASTFERSFGTLTKQGTFSNGESVYIQKGALT